MAALDLGKIGEGSATSAATTLSVVNTTGAIIPAGTLIHVTGTWDSINTATAPVIASSNIGGVAPTTSHGTAIGSGATTTAGTGIWHQCFRALTTADIASGATICILTSNQSAVKRVAVAEGYSGLTATLRNTVTTATSTVGTPSVISSGTALVAGDMVIASCSGENNAIPGADTDTLNGSWVAVTGIATSGGAANTNVCIGTQSKAVTATGNQTYNGTTAVDSVGCIFALVPVPTPLITQAAYRFYADGTESGSTALAAQDTGYTPDLSGGDASLLVRVRLQETNGGPVPSTDDWQLQWEKNASGTWSNLIGGTTVAPFASANLTEGAATTNRLGAGSGSFVAGKVSEDGTADNLGWTASNYTELLYAVTLTASLLVAGDTLRFRVHKNGSTSGMTYSQTPTLTPTFGPPPSTPGTPTITQDASFTEHLDVHGVALPSGATRNDIYGNVDGGAYVLGISDVNASTNWWDSSANKSTKPYTYKIRAVGPGGTTDGAASAAAYPNPYPPAFSLAPEDTAIDVLITCRPYVAKYKVYRRETLVGGSYTLVHTSATLAESIPYSWMDSGLTNGTSYDYVVSTEAQTPTVRESAQSALVSATPSLLDYFALLPSADSTMVGTWINYGGAPSKWQALTDDPAAANVSNGVQAPISGSPSYEVLLTKLPPGVAASATIDIYAECFSTSATVQLRQGTSTVIATMTVTDFAETRTQLALNSTQLALITNWKDLRLRIIVSGTVGDTFLVYSARLTGLYAPAYDPEVWDWSIPADAGTDDLTTNSFNVPAGATVLICSFCDTSGIASTRTITDNKGLTWTLDQSVNDAASAGNMEVYVWRAYTASAKTGMTVTVTMSQAFSHVIKPVIVTGTNPTGQPGTTGQSTDTGLISTTTLTPATEGSRTFFAAVHAHYTNTSPPVANAGTILGDGAGGVLNAFSWAVGISDEPWVSGTHQGVFEWPSVFEWSSIGIEIEPVPAGPAGPADVSIAVTLPVTATITVGGTKLAAVAANTVAATATISAAGVRLAPAAVNALAATATISAGGVSAVPVSAGLAITATINTTGFVPSATAPPSWVGGSQTTGDNITTKSVTFPSGIESGDKAVIFHANINTGSPVTMPDTQGFTLIKTTTDGSLTRRVYTKTCDGSEDNTVISFVMNGAERHSGVLGVYRDCTLGTLYELVETATDLSHDSPAATTTGVNEPLLSCVSERVTSGTTAYTPPTNFTKRQEAPVPGSGGTTTALADDIPSNPTRAASTVVTPGPWVGNNTAAANVVVTIIPLIPTAPPAGGPVSIDAVLAVTDTITVGGVRLAPAAATVAVTATIGAAVSRVAPVAATLAVTATITAAAVRLAPAVTTLPVTATITAGAVRLAPAVTTLPVTATITAAGQRVAPALTTLPVTATITAAGVRLAPALTTLPVTATISTAAVLAMPAGAVLAVTATIAATAEAAAPATLVLYENFSGISSGNFLPRTGWLQDDSSTGSLWQVYQGFTGTHTDVLFSQLSASFLNYSTGSTNHQARTKIKTSTLANNSVSGLGFAGVDATHYCTFELVKHEGGIGGVPTPESKITLAIRNGVPHVGEYSVNAPWLAYETVYDLKVEINNGHVKCWVDNTLYIDQDLTTGEAAAVAGGTRAGPLNFAGNANYDELWLYQLPGVVSAAATLPVTATITAGTVKIAPVATTLAVTATIGAAIERLVPAPVNALAVTATVTAAGVRLAPAVVNTIAVTSTITAGIERVAAITVNQLVVTSTITAAGVRYAPAVANTVAVTATITAAGFRLAPVTVNTVAVTATVTAGLARLMPAPVTTVAVTATILAGATGGAPIFAQAVVGTATITAGVQLVRAVVATLPVTATITATAAVLRPFGVNPVVVTATITAGALRVAIIGVSLPVTATVTLAPVVIKFAGIALVVTASISAAVTVVVITAYPLRVWNGSAHVAISPAKIKRWNGTAYEQAVIKVDVDGTYQIVGS